MPVHPSLPGPPPDREPSPDEAPANRAARRGKNKRSVPDQARYQPSSGHARPAQGRRINSVRRSG